MSVYKISLEADNHQTETTNIKAEVQTAGETAVEKEETTITAAHPRLAAQEATMTETDRRMMSEEGDHTAEMQAAVQTPIVRRVEVDQARKS